MLQFWRIMQDNSNLFQGTKINWHQNGQSFNKTILKSFDSEDPSYKFWKPLGASGSLWEPLGASGSLWEPLRASGSLWEPLGASGSLWDPLGASGRLWETLGTSRNLKRPQKISWSNECSKAVKRLKLARYYYACNNHTFRDFWQQL